MALLVKATTSRFRGPFLAVKGDWEAILQGETQVSRREEVGEEVSDWAQRRGSNSLPLLGRLISWEGRLCVQNLGQMAFIEVLV